MSSFNFMQKHNFRKSVQIFSASLLIIVILFPSQGLYAMGKKYAEQGARLTAAMNNALLSKGFCKTPRECHDLLPGTLETDTRILIHLYEIGEKNHLAFLVAITLSLTDGIRITNGVPITIKAFRETHEEHRESGLLIKDVKPFAIIEVIK
jgi:hypothetical protein